MKYLYIFCLMILMQGLAFSQSTCEVKHDALWLYGFNADEPHPNWGGSNIDWNFDPVQMYKKERDMPISSQNSVMCDRRGKLLFYSNGCYIANAMDSIMENGNGLNPGRIYNNSCGTDGHGYFLTQSMISIPTTDTNRIYVIHEALGIEEYPEVIIGTNRLYFTEIDMSANEGLGKVVRKNVPLYSGYDLPGGELTAVKNDSANAWWIICMNSNQHSILKFRADEDSIHFFNEQIISSDTIMGYGGAQAKFSPQGDRFARYMPKDGVFLYDFDRGTGEFSNFTRFGHIADSVIAGGCEFSPSGRFLYTNTLDEIRQYDLWADNIQSTEIVVAVYDGFQGPFPSRFFQMERTPDGRIFIVTTSGIRYLHQIKYPDRKGLACEVLQHSILLPTTHLASMPHFPNYRLPSMYEEPCDPAVGVNNTEREEDIRIFPNPVNDILSIESESQMQGVQIYDLAGQLIQSKNVEQPKETTLDVSILQQGMYLVKVIFEDNFDRTFKVIVN